MLALKLSGERVTVRAGGTADDVPLLIVAGMAGGIVPWPVVGHRTFDAKEPPVMVGDDQEERDGRVRVGHAGLVARFLYVLKDISILWMGGTGSAPTTSRQIPIRRKTCGGNSAVMPKDALR